MRIFVYKVLTIMYIIVALFTIGCAKGEYEQGDLDNPSITVIESNDVEIAFPDHFKETFDDGYDVKVHIDADVNASANNTIITVAAQQRALSVGDVINVLCRCIGKRNYSFISDWTFSKNFYQNKLDGLEPYKKIVPKTVIQFLQESYQDAPIDERKTVFQIEDSQSKSINSIYIEYENSFEPGILSYIVNGDFHFAFQRSLFEEVFTEQTVEEYRNDPAYNEAYLERIKPGIPSLSETDAIQYAQELLKDVNADLTLYKSEACSIISNYVVEKSTGWTLTFTKNVNGLQERHEREWSYTNPDYPPKNVAPYVNEYIQITIDSSGVCSFIWQGACDLLEESIKEAALFNTELLPQSIADTLQHLYKDHKNASGKGLLFEITEIDLGAALIRITESKEDRFIPVWYIYYLERWQDSTENIGKGMLIFNAIDGSYIEPRVISAE